MRRIKGIAPPFKGGSSPTEWGHYRQFMKYNNLKTLGVCAILVACAAASAIASESRSNVFDSRALYDGSKVHYLGQLKLTAEQDTEQSVLAELNIHVRFGNITSTNTGKCTLYVENVKSNRAPIEMECGYLISPWHGDSCYDSSEGYFCSLNSIAIKISPENQESIQKMLAKKARVKWPLSVKFREAMDNLKDMVKFGAIVRFSSPFPISPYLKTGTRGLMVSADWNASDLAQELPADAKRTGYPVHYEFAKRLVDGETISIQK
ncbi:MAG: hypothetical protein RJB38_2378 [Pseudomonadota bacterium]|jgi:hypothetical protein